MLRAPLILALVLSAGPAWSQTLAPGKPAGTVPAQHISYRTGFIALAVIAVAITFAVPGSSSSTTASTATTS